MKRIALLLILFVLAGCTQGVNLQAPFHKGLLIPTPKAFPVDQVRQAVDTICATPTVPDPKGNLTAGFWDGYNLNKKTTSFTLQELADISALKDLCNTPSAQRADYQIGYVIGRLLDDALLKFNAVQFLGPDAISIATLLGIMP